MALSSIIAELETSMLRFLDCARQLQAPTHQTPRSPPAPLRIHVSPSGDISLSEGELDPTRSLPSISSLPITLPTPPITGPACIPPRPPPIASSNPSDDAFSQWSPFNRTNPTRSFASVVAVVPPTSALPQPKLATPNPTNPDTSRVSVAKQRLQSKLVSLSSSVKRGTIVCFRCGDRGHLAKSCHNAVVCFACNRLGHRSYTCKAITMLPSSSRPPLTPDMKAVGSSLPLMRFGCTQSIRDFEEILRRGVVIKDNHHKGVVFIQSRLQERFQVENFT